MHNKTDWAGSGDWSRISRRGLLKGTFGAGALGLAVGGLASFPGITYAAALTKEERDRMTPDQVLELLMKGNKRFREGKMLQHDYLAQKRASAAGQYPAAAILSCMDSRTPAEIILDAGLGETFNARIAGNICTDDIVGSLEFGCALAGAKLILVMGHTACGAIRGAIDNVELGHLTGLLEVIKPAVESTRYDGERSGKNAGFVDAVAATNARLAVDEIRRKSRLLADLEKEGKIKIVGSMYHLTGGRIELVT
ncbi:carbonic anhydrase family protein [Microbulbifer rhizosphaerae]|uniref:Carbonic anhydrase n=1 Tax=Microbulbifer rhizosphaerae TaxID=1562603 RepID=A0A7W4Z7H5_9GAMM|nr:carbonic anhydrase family protein [Microbulbifer rhizosphaerae]MBB3059486.1 carbonic anhydrase [Microbulbifer rhizosphaerae]